MKKILTFLSIVFLSINLLPQSATITLRPQYVNLAATTSESAVLVTVSGYPSNTYKYRLYNGSNQYNCWDSVSATYISSSSYSSGPLIPPGTSITAATWWIVYQRGNNNATAASYRDRAGTGYSTNYQTVALPSATAMSSPFVLSGTVSASGGYELNRKYVILGFDAVSGGNLLCAASSAITTGAYSLSCHNGTSIKRIEVRTITNTTVSTVTNTSGWSSGTTIGDIPLPVELTSFSAITSNNSVKLKWVTATEVNNSGFAIERSKDSQNWQMVSFIKGAGNSNGKREYSYVDKVAISTQLYYRLKQVDNNGTFTYSPIVEVKHTLPAEFSLEHNYPNPFNPSTTISYSVPRDAKVELQVYSVSGQLVSTLVNQHQSAGTYSVQFNGNELSSGLYIYQLRAGGMVVTRKMTLLK